MLAQIIPLGARRKKKQNQLQNIENGYVVKDDIETGYGNIIPLWMFGMLY